MMINEAVIVMAIFGCGDSTQTCDYVATPDKTWSSIEACELAIPAHLQLNENANYPSLTAECEEKPTYVIAEPLPLPQKSVFDALREKSQNANISIFGNAAEQFVAAKQTFADGFRAIFVRD